MELSGYAFDRVCDVEPDRTERGAIEVHVPQPDYDRRDEKAVHDHGWGPFCSFGVPDGGTHRPGVYAIAVADEVAYVGETQDLYEQFAHGYGRISPANCFEGGQGTNCRLNTAVFHAARAGDRVSLHLHATDDFGGTEEENRALRRIIKDDLVAALDPAWNEASADRSSETETASEEAKTTASEEAKTTASDELGTAASDGPETGAFEPMDSDATASNPGEPEPNAPEPNAPEPEASTPDAASGADAPDRMVGSETERPRDAPTGEFAELYDYLRRHERDGVERSFAELEVVLDAPLPTEARRWRRWWTNDEASHPHSAAWLRAGYEVTDVSLPEGWVRFERLDGEPSPRTDATAGETADRPPARGSERPATGGFRRASPRRRE